MATIFMIAAAIGLLFKLNIWIAPVSTVCMFVALYYKIRNEDIEKLERKYRCPACKHEFEAEDPPETIPASFVFCPKCGGFPEEANDR